jgi:hypothetical protein
VAYNFPDAPTIGQIFQPFQWDGEKWIIAPKAGAGYALCYFSDTPPANPIDGALWLETDTGVMFCRYNDGNTTQWISVSPPQDTAALVAKAGDTMGGMLTLAADPTTAMHAATRQYVDNRTGLFTISFPYGAKPVAGAITMAPMAVPINVPVALAGTVGFANVVPAANAVFTLNKVTSAGVATALGTVTVPAGARSGFTLAGAGGSLVAGDSLQMVAPSTQDASLADIGITILVSKA